MKQEQVSFIGKECFFIDKVTSNKMYDGRSLGICISEGICPIHKLPVVYFDKPFLNFTWQYKSDVKTK